MEDSLRKVGQDLKQVDLNIKAGLHYVPEIEPPSKQVKNLAKAFKAAERLKEAHLNPHNKKKRADKRKNKRKAQKAARKVNRK